MFSRWKATLALVLLFAVGRAAAFGDLAPSGVQAAAAYSASRTGSGVLVIQHGKTLLATNPREAHRIYSGTKGFWMVAALVAAQEGIINLDERVSETISEWKSDARKSRITVRELISFTSGLEPIFGLHSNDFGDRNRAALAGSIVAEPGIRFIYGPAALQVFDEYFKRKLAAKGETPTQYLERKVLRPLHLGPQRYLADRAGNPLLAAGFTMTPSQWARLGELILDGGRPVVSSGQLAECFRGSSANRSFGIGFWNNRAAPGGRELDIEDLLDKKWFEQDWSGICICRDAPPDLVVGLGSGYQRLYVIPSLELIVVRFGNFGKFSDGTFLRMLLGK